MESETEGDFDNIPSGSEDECLDDSDDENYTQEQDEASDEDDDYDDDTTLDQPGPSKRCKQSQPQSQCKR